MNVEKGTKGFIKGRVPYNKGGTSWNKGLPANTQRCSACGSFIKKDDPHDCKSIDVRGDRFCTECGKLLNNTGPERHRKICGYCGKKKYRAQERLLRDELKAQLGGKCKACGYDRYLACLEFHHLNSAEKKSKHFLREVKNHPERFELLCNRCHREWHIEHNGGEDED